MTPALFATLSATTALAILLVTDLSVPFGPVRRWLQRGPHVETVDEVDGPWFVVRDGARDAGHVSPSAAAAHLSAGERMRAWGGELVSCPWCSGAWVAAAVLLVASIHYGANLLWYWPAVWFTSSAAVVVVHRLAD